MNSLPTSVDYSEPIPVLPQGTENLKVNCCSTNGFSFVAGQKIIVPLNKTGYLDPASLSIRYNLNLVVPIVLAANGTTGQSMSIPGCPVYTPIVRLDTIFDSNLITSVNNYNSVATALTNLKYTTAQKMGMQTSLGYISQAWSAAPAIAPIPIVDYSTINECTDGLTLAVGTGTAFNGLATIYTIPLSAPLPCFLSNAEKLIPLKSNIRLEFTLDTQTNVCPLAATQINNFTYVGTSLLNTALSVGQTELGTKCVAGQFGTYTITNFEVVYNQVSFAPDVERQILAMPKLRIKTTGYATGIQTIPSGIVGTLNLDYNLNYSSVKSILLLMGISSTGSGNSAYYPNKLFESIDVTGGQGSYIFKYNNVNYPQNELSVVNSKASIITELGLAMDTEHMAIDQLEFNKNDANVGAKSQSVITPGKFYVGVNTRKVHDKKIISGISTNLGAICASITLGQTATVYGYSAIMMLMYDGILEYNTKTNKLEYIM